MFLLINNYIRVGLDTPARAEREIVEMIKTGSIHATISQQDGMVR